MATDGHKNITVTVICCAIFVLGVFLQLKVIATLKRDQGMAWEINLTHSVVMIVHWSFRIFLETIQYIEPDYYAFFGKWFCYGTLIAGFISESNLFEIYLIGKVVKEMKENTNNSAPMLSRKAFQDRKRYIYVIM